MGLTLPDMSNHSLPEVLCASDDFGSDSVTSIPSHLITPVFISVNPHCFPQAVQDAR